MLKFKKSILVLFSFLVLGSFSFAAYNTNARAKRTSEYSSGSARAMSSYYGTISNVNVSGNTATIKETGQPFTGNYIEYSEIGAVRTIRPYKNGILDGVMYLYYDNGNLLKVINYTNGNKDGEEIEFYGNGYSKSIKTYRNGVLNGIAYDFDEFGRPAGSVEYVNNLKNGKEVKISNGVVIAESIYQYGRLNGPVTLYYTNGTVRMTGNYTSNLRNGQWTWNYENGSKRLIESYNNGIIYQVAGYNRDGSKEREIKLSNGSGEFTQYYSNGKVKAKGTLRNYKPYGNWNFYNNQGYVTDTQGFY